MSSSKVMDEEQKHFASLAQEPDRLKIHQPATEVRLNTFAEDVRAGLTATPKTLLPKYFYDELGSHLFEAICALPEYYLTRAESEILSNRADEIIKESASRLDQPFRLIELGNGSSSKTRFLIEALLRQQKEIAYLPIDISTDSLRRSSEELLRLYPSLRIEAYAADYFTALQALSASPSQEDSNDTQTIVLFLGSSIGNLDGTEARLLLQKVRNVLRPQDALLIGADLKKSAALLVPAYDDALGVTAAFNLNLLLRINREFDADFDLTRFRHEALYSERLGRVEMHILSRARQRVEIRALNLEIDFAEGESIHTENSYKYDEEELFALALDTQFKLARSWFDGARRFSLSLFVAV